MNDYTIWSDYNNMMIGSCNAGELYILFFMHKPYICVGIDI